MPRKPLLDDDERDLIDALLDEAADFAVVVITKSGRAVAYTSAANYTGHLKAALRRATGKVKAGPRR